MVTADGGEFNVQIDVINSGGNFGNALTAFITCVGSGGASPTLTGASPTSGTTAGGTSVTLSGTNLAGATAVTFGGTAGTVTGSTATSVTVTTPAHAAGAVDVEVTAPGGSATLTSGFTYVTPAPTLTGASPTSGTTAGGTSVTLSGTNLAGATAVTFGGTAGTVTGSTATSVTVTTPAHAAGAVDVEVTAPGGSATLTSGFTYVTPAPTLTGASPTSGTTAGGTSVTLSGTNLAGATAVTFGGTAGTVTGSTATSVTVTTPAHAAGAVDVEVTAPGGSATLTSGFTYVTPAPTLTGASPTSGTTAGGTSVTLSGTNLAGATAVTFGGTAGTVTGSTATTVTVTTPAHAAGAVDVEVTAPGGSATLTSGFTYVTPAPTLTGASPTSGTTAGGTSVTLSGTNLAGATAVTFGGTAGTVTGSTATSVTVTTPAHAAGAVDVEVTAPGGSATLTSGFTYVTPAPTLTGASPTSGTTAGGTSVTLSGTNLAGATAVTFGGTAGTVTGSTATSVTVTTPAHAAGAVDVEVTAPGGSATLTSGFTYVTPAPTLTGASPTSGTTAGGTSVTLSGTNLTGATAVTFGGTAGTVTGSTATSVTVTTPAHAAGAVDVEVTAPGGSATLTSGFTYTAASLALSPDAGALPGGTVAVAYSQTFSTTGGVGPYSYAVSAGALPAGLTLSPAGILSGTPTAAGNVSFSLTSTDANATTGTAAYSLAIAGAPPVAQNLQAQLLAGTSITVPLTAGATGGPFTAAAISTPPPSGSGAARITGGNGAYALVFTASAGAAGTVVVGYTLSNSWAASAPATISFTVVARPDPSQDPEVVGMLNAQAQSAQQLAGAQIRNFNDRLERLHRGTDRRESSLNIRLGMPQRPISGTDPSALAASALPENASGQSFGPFAAAEAAARSTSAFPDQGPMRSYTSSNPPPAPFTPAEEPDDGGPMFWGGGFVNFGSNKNYELDISQTMIGVSGGIDLQLQENFIAGIGFGYGRSAADVGSAGTNILGQAFSTALYGSYNAGKNVYFDALLGYSYLDFDSERYVTDTGAMAGGTRDGSQFFGSVTAGYEYTAGALLLSPYLRAEMAWSQLNGFTETGGGYYNLIYGEQTIFTLGTVLGLRTEYTIPVSWGLLTARGRLEYTHNFSSNSNATMGYADLGNGLPYELVVDPLAGDYATIGLGLDARLENGVVLGIDYRGTTSFSGEDVGQTIAVRASTRF